MDLFKPFWHSGYLIKEKGLPSGELLEGPPARKETRIIERGF